MFMRGSSSGNVINGKTDVFKIFPTCLSLAEIEADYNSGNGVEN